MKVICAICGQACDTGGCPTHGQASPMVDIAGHDMSWLSELAERSDLSLLNTQILKTRWAGLLQELIGIEVANTDVEGGDVYHGYRPYPISKFGKLLLISEKVVKVQSVIDGCYDPPRFLEVGCGPGTKLAVASMMFGMRSSGIEIDEYLAQNAVDMLGHMHDGTAAEGGWDVAVEDAEQYGNYSGFDIIFLNRPLRDYDREVALEQYVMSYMHTGAVLMLGNGLTQPMQLGWQPIAQDVACTVWRKACRCANVEDFLVFPRENAFEAVVLNCTLCGRDVEFM